MLCEDSTILPQQNTVIEYKNSLLPLQKGNHPEPDRWVPNVHQLISVTQENQHYDESSDSPASQESSDINSRIESDEIGNGILQKRHMIMKSKDEARKFFEQESEQRQTSNSPVEKQQQ